MTEVRISPITVTDTFLGFQDDDKLVSAEQEDEELDVDLMVRLTYSCDVKNQLFFDLQMC